MKNLLCIHDICTYSRSSLNIVMPTVSMLNIEAVVLPTALLSTQTDGFRHYHLVDLSNQMIPIMNHIKNEEAEINAIYTGYLAQVETCNIVKDIRNMYKDALYVLDPVLCDNGMLYSGFDESMVRSIKTLCFSANIITPNYSEALLLCDYPYQSITTELEIQDIAFLLEQKYKAKVVITSVPLKKELATVICENKKVDIIKHVRYKKHYPGCGDFFASILTSLLLSNYSLLEASKIATKISCKAVKLSQEDNRLERLGVCIEKVRKDLVNLV